MALQNYDNVCRGSHLLLAHSIASHVSSSSSSSVEGLFYYELTASFAIVAGLLVSFTSVEGLLLLERPNKVSFTSVAGFFY